MEKIETKNTVSINFRCTPEMKRSIEILTLVNRKKDVSTFITDVLSQVIEVNRGVIDSVNAEAFISPFANDEAPKKKKTPAQIKTTDAAPDKESENI